MGMQKIDMAIRSTMYVEDMDKLRHTLRGGHRPLEHGIAHFRHTPQNHRIVKEEVVRIAFFTSGIRPRTTASSKNRLCRCSSIMLFIQSSS